MPQINLLLKLDEHLIDDISIKVRDDINKEKVAQEVAERKAKFAAIDEALKNMK